MKWHYFTLAENQGGPGYVKILAKSANEAREIMFEHYGAEWAFQYSELRDIHPHDRYELRVISGDPEGA